MLIAHIYYLPLNARDLTCTMCFDLSRRAATACRPRVARILCVLSFGTGTLYKVVIDRVAGVVEAVHLYIWLVSKSSNSEKMVMQCE